MIKGLLAWVITETNFLEKAIFHIWASIIKTFYDRNYFGTVVRLEPAQAETPYRGLYYKTFYGCNLRIFIRSKSIGL
jgi:hypothetical protein